MKSLDVMKGRMIRCSMCLSRKNKLQSSRPVASWICNRLNKPCVEIDMCPRRLFTKSVFEQRR